MPQLSAWPHTQHWLATRNQSILRWFIIASVIFTCSYIVPLLSQIQMVLLLTGIAVLGTTIFFLRKPELGLVAMVPACIIVPLEVGTGTGTSLNAGVLLLSLLLALWLFEGIVRRQPIRVLVSPAFLPLLLFLLTCLLASSVGQLPWFPVSPAPLLTQVGGLAVFVLSGGAFLLVACRIRKLQWLQWMTWSFLIIGAIYLLVRLTPGGVRTASTLFSRGAVGSMFWVWLVSLAFSQSFCNEKLRGGWRIALLVLVAATFYVAYVQSREWVSGWLPPLATVIAILVARWWRLGILISIAGIVPAMELLSSLIDTDEYSYSTRLDAWAIVLEMVKDSAVLGLGPANYYWYTPLFRIRGYAVVFNSHSQYVDLIAQTGILGLVCFLWLFGVLLFLAWRLRTQVAIGFASAYVYGVLGGLVGTLVAAALGDWVLPFVYNIGITGMRSSLLAWLFLGGLVALEQMLPKMTSSSMDSRLFS